MRKIILALLGLAVRISRKTPLVKVKWIKQVYYLIYSKVRPQGCMVLDLEGFRLKVDPRDEGVVSFLLTTGKYEPYEVSLIEQIVKDGHFVVDIGANIGYHSVILAKLVGSSGHVMSCEPDENNFSMLMTNLDLNHLSARVNTVKCAIGEKNGSITLYKNEHNLGDHRTYANDTSMQQRIEVPMYTVDHLVPPGTKVDMVKMDIQGFEYFALKGMNRLLRENKDLTIFMEFWPDGFREAGCDPKEVANFLLKQEFETYKIQEHANKIVKLTREDFMNIADEAQQSNLLLVRGDVQFPEHLS